MRVWFIPRGRGSNRHVPAAARSRRELYRRSTGVRPDAGGRMLECDDGWPCRPARCGCGCRRRALATASGVASCPVAVGAS